MSEAWRDETCSSDERAEALLAEMTRDEKVAQLGCVWSTGLVEGDGFSRERARKALSEGIGEITRIAGGSGLRPAEVARFTNAIQRFLQEETRLGIPAIVHEESCAGFLARDATQFPQAIGLASTWDPDLVERIGQVIRRQMLAVGARHTLAPVLDVQGTCLRDGVPTTGKHFPRTGLVGGRRRGRPTRRRARAGSTAAASSCTPRC